MKRSIFFLLAFYPAMLVGQNNSNFQIKNGLVYYSKVFDFPGQPHDSITRYLQAALPLVPYVSSVRVDEAAGITASIAHMQINFDGLSGLLNDAMFANVVVQVKDGRYRVVVKDIYFVADGLQNDDYTDFTHYVTKDGFVGSRIIEEFSAGLGVPQMLLRMDQYFTTIFDVPRLGLDDW